MGGAISKHRNQKHEEKAAKFEKKATNFAQKVKTNIADEFYKRAMLQREIQMTLNVARARDTIQIYGSAWLALVAGVGIAKVAKKRVPGLLGIPIVAGGGVLASPKPAA